MSDILGPADAVNAVTVRPAEDRTFLTLDSWFKDCTSPTSDDGTDLTASFLNGAIAAMRSVWRMNGNLADGVTPVVAELGNDDTGLKKAILHIVQRGQTLYGVDTGTANNIVVALSPAPLEYKAGMTIRVKVVAANAPGLTVINCNGLGNKSVLRKSGSNLFDGDLLPTGIYELIYDGTNFQLQGAFGRPVLLRDIDLYVDGSLGNDANSGTAASPFKTLQKAADYAFSYGPSQYTVNIHAADYAAYEPVVTPANQGPYLDFVGNAVTPGNCVVDGGTASNCFSVYGPNIVSVNGFTVKNTAGTALHSGFVAYGSGATIKTSNTKSLGMGGGAVFHASTGGTVLVQGNHTFSGNSQILFMAAAAGQIAFSLGAVTLNVSTPLIVTTVCVCVDVGVLNVGGAAPPWTGSAVTGKKYDITLNGVADVAGAGINYFPGSTAGTTANGGQYS